MKNRMWTWIVAGVAVASLGMPAHSQDATPQPSQAASPQAQPAAPQINAPASQDAPPDPTTPQLKRRDDQIMTLESTTRLVVLDVVVTDPKGHSIKGLQAKDFVLTEDGTPQTISNVVEHTSLSPEAAAAEAARMKLPPNTFSNYGQTNEGGYMVFLIDALDNQVQDQMRLRQSMLGYMKTVPYGTKIAIFQLDTQMRMVQGFTTDPAVLLAAVQSKRDSPGFSPVLGNPAAAGAGTVARDPLAGAERGSGEMQNQIKRNRSIILKAGMEALGKYLSGFPGRKSLIWFTGDVPVWVPGGHMGGPAFHDDFADQTSFIDDMNKTTDVLRLGQIAVYPVDMRGLTLHGGMTSAVQHGTLDDIADATGGKAFYNTNGLTQAMAEVADDTSNYYTVSYTPTNRNFDGSYRKLAVTLPAQPLDKLAYRPGYTARSDDYELAQHKAQRQQNRGPLTVAAVGAPPVTAIDKSMPLGPASRTYSSSPRSTPPRRQRN
jgi:VWFA-related protein